MASSSIGIIANPASGKDIRRLVSYATIIDNREKVNIIKRIILGAQYFGVDHIYFMPDSFQMGWLVEDELQAAKVLKAKIEILEMPCKFCMGDSVVAAQKMEELGVGCILVLGGDGTSRAVAKGITHTPIIPISTGTNNVYPVLVEGTVAGMAAAFAILEESREEICIRDKRIELYLNGEFTDIALIDAVITKDNCIGSKAIWDVESIKNIIVTRCSPAGIGFSTIAGCLEIIRPEDDFGYAVESGSGGDIVCAPVAAGVIEKFQVGSKEKLLLDHDYKIEIQDTCVAALDGEREILLRKGDSLIVRITRNGPWRVKIKETIEKASRDGRFRL